MSLRYHVKTEVCISVTKSVILTTPMTGIELFNTLSLHTYLLHGVNYHGICVVVNHSVVAHTL